MKISPIILIVFTLFISCEEKPYKSTKPPFSKNPKIIILGTAQDAGSPQIGCEKKCCKPLFKNPDASRKVVSLGLIDNQNQASYIFEATPDFPQQAALLKNASINRTKKIPDGIFLTHAHIGHYTGLMYLGKEAINSKNIPVFAMPKMKQFLESNGPWSQLISNKNIDLQAIKRDRTITLTEHLQVIPLIVPHRDEFSETVGYKIIGPNKKALFVPDIDKWEKWDQDIIEEIKKVDYAFVDATFYDAQEINNRDISQIPHPFVVESMERFSKLPATEKEKIIFIHFNHTNPLLNQNSKESSIVLKNGFKIARIKEEFEL